MALKGLMTRGAQGLAATTRRMDESEDLRTEPTAAPVRATLAQAPGPRTVAPSTSVDAGSELEGRLRCKDTLRIDGRVVGEIECEKMVIIGEGGRVHACIEADEVHVSGVVEGDVTARRKVTLDRTAVVVGDLTTPGIVIEEGAKLQGRILIGSDAEAEDLVANAKDARLRPDETAGTERGAPDVDAASAPAGSKKPKKASGASKAGDEGPKAEHAAPAPA